MNASHLLEAARQGPGESPPPVVAASPDYHAMGTFSETWAFLQFFLQRAVIVIDGMATGAPPIEPNDFGLKTKLAYIEAAFRLAPELGDLAPEALALTHDIELVAARRQALLQAMARESLNRLGMHLFEIPNLDRSRGDCARSSGALNDLHLKTCDLVRRSLLLATALEVRKDR
jgi:hypothetical protein